MPRHVITPEQEKEMRQMGETMNAMQISRSLKLKYNTVLTYMKVRMIDKKMGKSPRTPEYRRDKNKVGMFNVNAVENWLI
jgi:hypothetical protein